MAITKVQFILGYATFIFFVVNITAMFSTGSVTSGSSGVPPPPPFDNPILGVFSNLWWFIGLSSVSSSYALLNTLIFAPLIVALVWAIGELIVEAIP